MPAPAMPGGLSRRRFSTALGGTALLLPAVARAAFPAGSAIDGALPDLSFRMTRSSDGKLVTAADYRGYVVVLYFGFTRCADTCPLTMHNLALILRRMGPLAARMRVLFVTIDLAHDTLPRLRRFVANFGSPPRFDGLRGTPAELAAMAKRDDVLFHAPSRTDAPDPVSGISHSSFAYVFGPHGKARDLLSTISNADVDLAAMTEGFNRLARSAG